MSKVIPFEEIMTGDTIRHEYEVCDVKYTNEGVAVKKMYGLWESGTGLLLISPNKAGIIRLIDRPKHSLPTTEGTVIFAEMPTEDGTVALVLQDGKWKYLSGGSFYHAKAVENYPWRLAKVVEA